MHWINYLGHRSAPTASAAAHHRWCCALFVFLKIFCSQCLRNKDALVRERTAGHRHSLPRDEPPRRAEGVRRVTPPPPPLVASEIRGINGCCFKPHAVKVVYLFVTSDVTTHPCTRGASPRRTSTAAGKSEPRWAEMPPIATRGARRARPRLASGGAGGEIPLFP